MTTPINVLRVAGVLCAIAVAVSASACGSDDGNEGGATAADTGRTVPGQADTGSAVQQPATDEGQIKALIASTQAAFKSGDGKVVCNGLTAAGQKDIVAYGKAVGTPGSCVEVAKGIAAYNKKEGFVQQQSKVVTVRVRGNTALAVLRIKGTGPLRQRLRKVDGQWKQLPYGLAALAGGTATP